MEPHTTSLYGTKHTGGGARGNKPSAVQSWYLEGDLGGEDELVPLEESSGGVHEHRIGDAVYQVLHPLLDIF